MVNPYHAIITYQEDNWEEYLGKMCLIDIFQELLKEYPDSQVFKCVIKYIVWAYSLNSDMILLGNDWQKNKERVFEAAQVHPMKDLYEDLVLLKNEVVLNTISRWLKFQDNETFESLQSLKDLKSEMQLSSVGNIKKSSNEIDYDQKFKNAGYVKELRMMIKDLESELVQNDMKLKEAVKEVKAKKSANTMGVERFI